MQQTIRVFLLFLLGGWMAVAGAHAQGAATLTGTVTDTDGEPLPGANVVLVGTSIGTAVGQDGSYELTGIDPGEYTVRVTFVGYQRIEETIQVSAGETVRRDFEMQEAAIRGEGVTVTVGSRATKTAADQLAVPVDVYSAEDLEVTGTTETGLILQQVAPSVNFPRQTVADGMDALRPFSLRGLSPDHTLVLINGKRRHKSALVNRLGSGIQKGSSTVDLNAIPASAIGQIEVLRDGASAQYGSDAIAGVVNIRLKDEPLPFTIGYKAGGHVTDDYENDGFTQDVNAAYGLPLGDGYLNLFAEVRLRNPTNRAGASPRDQIQAGDGNVVGDVDGDGVNEVVEQRNPVEQPNFHWGNGESDNFYGWGMGAYPILGSPDDPTLEAYAFGGYSFRDALGQGFYRRSLGGRNWPSIYPIGFLPEFDVKIRDYSASGGVRGASGAWTYDVNLQTGRNDFEYNIDNSLNVTLGPDSDKTSFYAGTVALQQSHVMLDVTRTVDVSGFESPLNVAFGAVGRLDQYEIEAGERASWVDGPVKENQNGGRAAPGAQVFPGFRPEQARSESRTNLGAYLDLEADVSEQWLVNLAGRFERYSDFGSTINGKLALRFQPQEEVIFRGAVSTGFRAPNLAQRYFSKVSTTFIDNEPFEVGLFTNDSNVADALGVPSLEEEKSYSLSGGLAVSPTKRFTFTADVFFIDIRDRIILSGNLAGDEIENLVSQFGAQRVQVFSNAIDTRTWGIDLTTTYTTVIQEEGRLRLKGAFNTTRNFTYSDVRTPRALSADFGESIFGREARLELERERPNNTLKLNASYDRGPFSVTLGTTRYGTTLVPDDFQNTSACTAGCALEATDDFELSPEWVVDMEARYDLVEDYATIAVGARNLLDNYPDLTPDGENFLGIFPYSTASPFGFNGRYVYSRLTVTF
jgi:iron complex outermembrane receptor protein